MTAPTSTADHLTAEVIARMPAAQQPPWPDAQQVRHVLRNLPQQGFIDALSIQELSQQLARAHDDESLVLQLGDCVENIDSDVHADTLRKLRFIDEAAGHLCHPSRPVIRVGRLAGQHAKPRSSDFETVNGQTLPSYRGPAVNDPDPTPAARLPSASKLAHSWAAAQAGHTAVADYHREHSRRHRIWTSHEMLLIDYELAFLTYNGTSSYLSTTHWPWVGARTRQLDGAHVALAAAVDNPVSVKVDATVTPDTAVELARRINPDDAPGKLTFISRMGRQDIVHLAVLAQAIRERAPRVLWVCDPMHGNTVSTSTGIKTRHVEHIIDELTQFQQILLDQRQRPAGIHLEASPDNIFECSESGREPTLGRTYTTLLDPRLNHEQTVRVLSSWFA
ncbi:3-deoxy-7-phosphoheptulonate synthase [Auritidibacter sp. NML100628]|uniref:3-deoxy-7-phosphoheptulonate synthase n=1 Tax=Auritidibacter sp. NML100628 TaxID=2170742 RepID=UPI00131469F7|nr:3-deoxy-7-phosphoheptulonate synthase [Auritidibacter sp. NML100628]